jgi:hypothetical protein
MDVNMDVNMIDVRPAATQSRAGDGFSMATFWAGRQMPALDRACLASFVSFGYAVTVYSFDRVEGLPAGVTLADAGAIVPPESVHAFIYGGTPNLSHFSDYFRYCLFAKTDHTWIDTDMLLLRPITVAADGDLFAKETDTGICGAIMRIGHDNPHLATLIRRTEQLMGSDLVWGATGPRLLNQVMGRAAVLQHAHPQSAFFPMHYDAFWKPFLPSCRDECERLCRDAFSVHLWNNIVVKMGVWKELAPPAGSFLHARLQQQGSLDLFRDTYPEAVMRNMASNWLLRKSGGDIGVIKLAKQVFPSLLRTTVPRVRAMWQMRLGK